MDLMKLWKDCLLNLENTVFSETGEQIEIIEEKHMNKVIKLFVKYRVDPQKIMANILAILFNDLNFPFVTDTIKSNKKLLNFIDRPQAPIWYLAGFLDVIFWYNEERYVNKSIDGESWNNSCLKYMLGNNIINDKFDYINIFDLTISLYKEKIGKDLEIITDIDTFLSNFL